MNTLIFLPVPSMVINAGLDNRQSWWIRHPQVASKLGNTPLFLKHTGVSSVRIMVFGGTGREPKKTPPLRLPSLALSCGYPIHPILKIIARDRPMNTPHIRTLKRYTAVSINNLINRFSVTAYSLKEAKSLLPAFAVITAWSPAQEGSL